MLLKSHTVRRLTLQMLKAAYEGGGENWGARTVERAEAIKALGGTVLQEFCVQGIQASIVEVDNLRVLLVPGTNEEADWRVNIMAWPFPFNGRFYHHGFLRVAVDLLDWIDHQTLHLITGHSYGAAVSQIVGSRLQVPTLAWASPRVLWSSVPPIGARFVRNIVATDDPIRFGPSALLRYAWIGETESFHPGRRRLKGGHSVDRYLEFYP